MELTDNNDMNGTNPQNNQTEINNQENDESSMEEGLAANQQNQTGSNTNESGSEIDGHSGNSITDPEGSNNDQNESEHNGHDESSSGGESGSNIEEQIGSNTDGQTGSNASGQTGSNTGEQTELNDDGSNLSGGTNSHTEDGSSYQGSSVAEGQVDSHDEYPPPHSCYTCSACNKDDQGNLTTCPQGITSCSASKGINHFTGNIAWERECGLPDLTLQDDFCHEFITEENTVVHCSCKTSHCNNLEFTEELMERTETADKDSSDSEVRGLECFQCSGVDDKCTDQEDPGSIKTCSSNIITCSITRLVDSISGIVGINNS